MNLNQQRHKRDSHSGATRVELARSADATRLASMSRSVIEHGLPWRWRPQAIARLIRDHDTAVVIARERGRIVGFGAMKFRFAASEAHLLLLAVEPDRRRDGIGSELVAWFEKIARRGGVESIGHGSARSSTLISSNSTPCARRNSFARLQGTQLWLL